MWRRSHYLENAGIPTAKTFGKAWDIPIEQLTKAWNAAMKAEEPFAVKQVQAISANKQSQNTTEPVQGFYSHEN